ncbi:MULTISPECIES: hypothetical protein [unclassified Sphingopyxis]|uniref:hypothetical protein n=1 Tax=unclassified Sphingopyxis TaxID=2614943 RepID=UPI0012E35C07|nr:MULTISPECIES: hypothetical protein [unclassified Sphingopyxis]
MIKPTPRLLVVLFVIIAFDATPFIWLIARDMASVSFVSDKQVIEQRKKAIFAGLVDEVQRRQDIDHVPGFVLTSIILSYPSCETLVGGTIRIDHKTSRTRPEPILRSRAEIAGFFRAIAPNRLAMRGYQINQASQAFGSLEASVIRACIAATPFQATCMENYQKAVADKGSRFEERLVELGFLKIVAGASSDWPGYCYALPDIEISSERP